MSNYTELIERLRVLARYHGRVAQDGGLLCSRDSDAFNEAADAIETLSNGINAYSDEAFKRAQECADLRRRIEELIDKYAEKAADEHAPAPSLDIFYICDHRACGFCGSDCNHTADIRHAQNFELRGGALFEKGRF